MKTNITILTALVLLFTMSLNAQVAINTDGSAPDGSAMLEIESTSGGILIPRMTQSQRNSISSPATGLLIWQTDNTPGFYYNAGTPASPNWTGFGSSDDWTILGNAGTSSATNFLGTTDNVSLPIRTNDTERIRILNSGEVVVNSTTPYSGDAFSTYATGSNWAINGYSATGPAIYGQASGFYSVYGNSGYSVASIRARNTHATGTGLLTSGNNQGGSYLATGTGIASSGADGIYAKGTDSDGTGVLAVGNNGGTVYSVPQGSGGAFYGYHGLFGKGSNTSNGIGVIGVGNDSTTFHYVSGGNGGAFSGSQAGVYGYATNTTDGTGVVGVGNRDVYYSLLSGIGSGGAFSSSRCGVYGRASSTSGDRYGGYFYASASPSPQASYAYVGAIIGGTRYKINGNGNVSSIVTSVSGDLVTLTCPEAPEILLQDYGIGKLQNGKARIEIDPNLTMNINVDSEHPLKVFITLEGDCNGVYVTNKSANGFNVIELGDGTSNVSFSWQIVATRADEYEGGKLVSNNSRRFQPALGPLQTQMEKGSIYKQNTIQLKRNETKNIEEKNIVKETIK